MKTNDSAISKETMYYFKMREKALALPLWQLNAQSETGKNMVNSFKETWKVTLFFFFSFKTEDEGGWGQECVCVCFTEASLCCMWNETKSESEKDTFDLHDV